jgi:hypothetical protein
VQVMIIHQSPLLEASLVHGIIGKLLVTVAGCSISHPLHHDNAVQRRPTGIHD